MKQCIVCNEEVDNEQALNSHSAYGQILCRTCHEKANEHGGIPGDVIKIGWAEYVPLCWMW